MRVKRSRCSKRPRVTTDGEGLVSHAGAGLLAEMADRSGLTDALSEAMSGCGISWRAHDPGVVVSHLAVAVADGADCLSDLATLREQPELFGLVASQATAWRAIEAVTAPELRGIARAATVARDRVWAAGGGPATVTFDFDATLVTAHSDKQDAAATYKRGFGFHPLAVWLDETASRWLPCCARATQERTTQLTTCDCWERPSTRSPSTTRRGTGQAMIRPPSASRCW